MIASLRSLVALAVVASTCSSVLALNIERREGKFADPLPGKTAGGTFKTTGHSAGPVKQNGDPGIQCPKITDPALWTVAYKPLPAGCYEEGQTVTLKWSITDQRPSDDYGFSASPIIKFLFYTVDAKGDIISAPAMPPLTINGKLDPKPVCASQGEALFTLPPPGKLPAEYIYPQHKGRWGVAALEWVSDYAPGKENLLAEAPTLPDVTNGKGFVITTAGGCKNFPK